MSRDKDSRDANSREGVARPSLNRHGPIHIPEEFLPERELYKYEWISLDPQHTYDFRVKLKHGYQPVREDMVSGAEDHIGDDFFAERGYEPTGGYVVRKQPGGKELYLCRILWSDYEPIQKHKDASADELEETILRRSKNSGLDGNIDFDAKR